jgi:hypothetical protein
VAGQAERERQGDVVVGCFFPSSCLPLRVLFITNSYVRGKQWIAGIISKCWKQCASSCLATDSWLFGQNEHNCASSSTLLTWPGSRRLFLISQTEIHFERTTKVRRRSYAQSRKMRTRTVSRSGNGVGCGASMQEGGVLWRR